MRNFMTARELRASVRKLTLALGATAALAGGTTIVLTQASAKQQAVTFSAYPMPGTLTAAQGTDISFRGGGDAAALGAVKVTGSRSGDHPGALKAHSDGQGVTFAPGKEFEPGETVT